MPGHRRSTFLTPVAIGLLAMVVVACSDDSDSASSSSASATTTEAVATTAAATTSTAATTTDAVTTTEVEVATTEEPTTTEQPTTTEAPTTEVPTTEAALPVEWVMQDAPEDCMCADGQPFNFWSRMNDPEKVVLYFQGGGACFSAASCSFTDGTYDPSVDEADNPAGGGGIFDFENADNPFAGWSAVYVPYCTGDVHLGDTTTEYSPDLTVQHKGYLNAQAALDYLAENFPDATDVFVTGSSAGGIPSPLFGGLVSDRLPEAEVAVLADASGGYRSIPGINSAIGSLWGTTNHVPDWPETSGITAEQYGVPDLFVYAGRHDPTIRMARFDNAWDETQRAFANATGMGDIPLPEVLDLNEQLVETAGIDLSVYVAPGDNHTILGRNDVYSLEVEGVRFLDWLTRFVEGEAPGDVTCTDCQPPPDVAT